MFFTLVFGLENCTEFPSWFHQKVIPKISNNIPDEVWFGPRTWHISLASYSVSDSVDVKLLSNSVGYVKKLLQSKLNELNDICVNGFQEYWGYMAFTWTTSTKSELTPIARFCCKEFEQQLKLNNIEYKRQYAPDPHCTIRAITKQVLDEISGKFSDLPKEMTLMPKKFICDSIALHIGGSFKNYQDYYNRQYNAIYSNS